ncbi:MAG: M23 family metallopeptidase [Chitinophagaceae bacterium]|nr:M23 family metallopeptidase [Chitinophagaceae bacterium]
MRFTLSAALMLFAVLLYAQPRPSQEESAGHSKTYFRYPLNIPVKLNANFGEMRPNHFHMGLDLFTQRKENLPIYAAADGYVARIKIEPGGFGRAIYLNHPNGLTTLYAHMNDFMPELEEYVKEKQYEKESWQVDLDIPEADFPVKKGTFIGYSGNTGGSQGPHVHFEIRETTTEKCLNPLMFDLNIPDKVPPDVYRLVVYNRNISTYEQSPLVYPLKKVQGVYVPAGIIKVNTDKVVFAIQAADKMSGVPNANGIFEATLYKVAEALNGFKLARIGYDETRYLNAHTDYRIKNGGGPYYQYLFPLPGNGLDIYRPSGGKPFFELPDTVVQALRIEVKDAYGNTSQVKFSVQRTGYWPVPARPGYKMKAGEVNVYETENMQVYLPENALYDSLNFTYTGFPNADPLAFSGIHHIHTYTVPVHANYTLRVKPDKIIPYHLRDRLLIKKITKNNISVKKAVWELGWYKSDFRDFGIFQLIADTEPPQVISYSLKDGANLSKLSKLVVSVTDNYNQVKNFRAELDGEWLMFSQRGNTFTYKFDEHCPRGEHELKISVEDEAGNKTEKTFKFTR